MPNPNHRFLVALLALCVVHAAHGATCDAGYYLDNGECTICPYYAYCPGDDMKYDCPLPSDHLRTTFPDNYYNPTKESTGYDMTATGFYSPHECRALTWMRSERGRLYEYVRYNPETEQYDITTSYAWAATNPGYYLMNKAGYGVYLYYHDVLECPAGSYCPGKDAVAYNKENQATAHTETFGLETCPAGHYCPAGAVAPTPCPAGTVCTTVGASDDSVCKPCINATYSDTPGATACTPCPVAKTYADVLISYDYWNNGISGDHTTDRGCRIIMTGAITNGVTDRVGCYLGTDNDYGNGGGKTCWVHQQYFQCNSGYYAPLLGNYVWNDSYSGLLANACIPVGGGYYSPDGALSRVECPAGLTTIGYGAGADEAADCGHALHIGDATLHLRSEKKTTPSLNVRIGDQTFYGNMATTPHGTLRINMNGTTYSVYDDSM